VERWIDEAPADESEAIVVAPSENHSGMFLGGRDVFTHPSRSLRTAQHPGSGITRGVLPRGSPGVVRDPRRRGQLRVSTGPDSLGINAGANVGPKRPALGHDRAILTGAQLGLSDSRSRCSGARTSITTTAGEVAIEVLQELMKRAVSYPFQPQRAESLGGRNGRAYAVGASRAPAS